MTQETEVVQPTNEQAETPKEEVKVEDFWQLQI